MKICPRCGSPFEAYVEPFKKGVFVQIGWVKTRVCFGCAKDLLTTPDPRLKTTRKRRKTERERLEKEEHGRWEKEEEKS